MREENCTLLGCCCKASDTQLTKNKRNAPSRYARNYPLYLVQTESDQPNQILLGPAAAANQRAGE